MASLECEDYVDFASVFFFREGSVTRRDVDGDIVDDGDLHSRARDTAKMRYPDKGAQTSDRGV